MTIIFWVNDVARPEYELTSRIISAAIEVHRELGPGLLEKAYEECLCAELLERGLRNQRQVLQPIIFKHRQLTKSYKIDLIVEKRVLVELKAIRTLTDADVAQTLTYLKLSKLEVALLINFNSYPLSAGIRRLVRTL
jgi:GxxExxY protein